MKYKVIKTTIVGYAMNKDMAKDLVDELARMYSEDKETYFHIEPWKK